jgi:hypothetical protein
MRFRQETVFYSYHEGERKGHDQVCPFLLDHTSDDVPDRVKELYLFSDNFSGQNMNHTVVRFLAMLTASKLFHKILHYFPLQDPSYMPCDRDFVLEKRLMCHSDRVYELHEYTILIVR